jgi:hypothetical protein
MHIEYRVSERDYRKAVTLAKRKRSKLSALELFWPYLFAIAWMLIGFIPRSISNNAGGTDDLYFQLGVIPFVLLFLLARQMRLRSEYVKLSNYRLLQALDLDASGLRLVTSQVTARTSWSVYEKFAENESVFILYQEGNQGIVPITKAFLTYLQIEELRSLLEANLTRA